jgi:hypothetical protein
LNFNYDWDASENGTGVCPIVGLGNICGDEALFTLYNLSNNFNGNNVKKRDSHGDVYGNWHINGVNPFSTVAPTPDIIVDPPPPMTICINGGLDGGAIRMVDVPCVIGDYSCQAHYVCEAVTGQSCIFQSYCCCGSCTGSWYNPSVGYLYFNFDWDISNNGNAACPVMGYGNICGSYSLFPTYNLSNAYSGDGYGNWYVDGYCPAFPPAPTDSPTEPPVDNPTDPPTDVPPTFYQPTYPPTDVGPPTTSSFLPICVSGALGGVFYVNVPCNVGDWSCQGKYVCEAVLGTYCIFQSSCCCGSCSGSWYNPNVGYLYFNYDWDINGGTCGSPGYGNICGNNPGLFSTYNLSTQFNGDGYGDWFRDGVCDFIAPTYPPSDPPTDPPYQPTDPPTDPPYQPTDPPTDPPYQPTDPPTEPPYQPSEWPTQEPDPPTTSTLMTICIDGGQGGLRTVDVPCGLNDYSCQGKYVCEAVLGQTCIFQTYCCCGSCTGSWYNPSVGYLYFNFDWDVSDNGNTACPVEGYGNICGYPTSQFSTYNLSSFYYGDGFGN